MARTHGVHAEPTTFGLKVAVWYVEAGRNLERLRRAREAVARGQALGRGRQLRPRRAGDRGGGLPRRSASAVEPVSTQIVQRDRHAEFCATLAIAGASLEKIALEIRGLQRTEVLEAQEPFGEGQKGSSAMPHKRNPELAERICGLARLLRSNALAALENVALWHERDISHSSVERVILPDSTILLDYMLDLTTFIVEGLDVDPARMAENLEPSHGLIYSQRVLLKLTESGLARQVAYELVQRHAMRAWKERRPLLELLAADPAVTERAEPGRAQGVLRSRLVRAQRGRDLPAGGSVDVKVRVLVRLKPGILDVQGAAVQRALAGLGFARRARAARGQADRGGRRRGRRRPRRAARVDEMCRRLLANTILEDYTIEAERAERLAPSGAVR